MREIHPIIIELLKQRGILGQEEIEEFLSEKPQKMHDPFLLHNMRAGVDLIVSALNEGKRICIYGDYDADGITATTLMMDALSTVTDNLFYYIPSRFEEGYGLNDEAIDMIYQNGCQLLITVDCGSVSRKEVARAMSLGMDVLVTDHHSIGDNMAQCVLINPKQVECNYPFAELAGCGVAFKVIQALVQEGVIARDVLVRSMDLVAIGTIGDVVPLVEENRAFAKYGIRSINMGLRPGLKLLLDSILPRQRILNSDNISFAIVPHLNASGRMDDASIAVELLRRNRTTGEEVPLETIAKKIIANNELRRKTQVEDYEKCKNIVEEKHKDDKFLVIRADDVHEGIAGIVAGKVKEYYDKPTIIVTKSRDSFKGTGRSVEGVNLYELLSNHKDKFERFGGHAGACGFTIDIDKLDELRECLLQEMSEFSVKEEPITDPWDLEVELKQLDKNLAKAIEEMAPFGNKNPKPIFAIKDVSISNVKYMGDNYQHMRFDLCKEEYLLPCILFNDAKKYINTIDERGLTIIGSLEVQRWNGRERAQFVVEEIK